MKKKKKLNIYIRLHLDKRLTHIIKMRKQLDLKFRATKIMINKAAIKPVWIWIY